METRTLIETNDGSHSLALSGTTATYHSHHGALSESMHVFIEKGLKIAPAENGHLNILEVGMGTGLNVLLTYLYLPETLKLNYHALELYPVDAGIIEQINYPEVLQNYAQFDPERTKEIFQKIHQWQDGKPFPLDDHFNLTVWQKSIIDWMPREQLQLVYYDAFAPSHQPEMWSTEIFSKIYDSITPGGILVTFCAQGAFKRNLKAAGFDVESIDGPPGKREMTRGVKI